MHVFMLVIHFSAGSFQPGSTKLQIYMYQYWTVFHTVMDSYVYFTERSRRKNRLEPLSR